MADRGLRNDVVGKALTDAQCRSRLVKLGTPFDSGGGSTGANSSSAVHRLDRTGHVSRRTMEGNMLRTARDMWMAPACRLGVTSAGRTPETWAIPLPSAASPRSAGIGGQRSHVASGMPRALRHQAQDATMLTM